jgi:flagellar hook protein FlgE
MSLFSALTTVVGGAGAQSFAMTNIADNIANSQTLGYRRVDTRFADLVVEAPISQQTGGSVSASSQGTMALTGPLSQTGVATNFALSGPGFVTVRRPDPSSDSGEAFSGMDLYTRRGDFSLNRDGYLVNGAGYLLVGSALDPITGRATGAAPDIIKVESDFLPARGTKSLSYVGNLPATPHTGAYSASVAGSDIWAAAGGVPPGIVGPGTVPDTPSLLNNSIDGQSVRLYDSVGRAVDVGLRWTKLGSAGNITNWALYAQTQPAASAAQSRWSLAAQVSFDSTGSAVSPTAVLPVDLSARGLGPINLDLTGRHLTQYADPTGQANIQAPVQDGNPAGSYSGVQVGSGGEVIATYSNGQTRPVARIAVAQFKAPDMLQRTSGAAFAQTIDSGPPTDGSNWTTFAPGSVEGSNVDVASEFSKMIVTQQAYGANTRVITTVKDMFSELLNATR